MNEIYSDTNEASGISLLSYTEKYFLVCLKRTLTSCSILNFPKKSLILNITKLLTQKEQYSLILLSQPTNLKIHNLTSNLINGDLLISPANVFGKCTIVMFPLWRNNMVIVHYKYHGFLKLLTQSCLSEL